MSSRKIQDKTVCIIGLGYVGLPLAEAFSKHLRTIGYRRNQKKIDKKIIISFSNRSNHISLPNSG